MPTPYDAYAYGCPMIIDRDVESAEIEEAFAGPWAHAGPCATTASPRDKSIAVRLITSGIPPTRPHDSTRALAIRTADPGALQYLRRLSKTNVPKPHHFGSALDRTTTAVSTRRDDFHPL